MANISETILKDDALNIILNKYSNVLLQHVNLKAHQLSYIKRNWYYKEQLKFALSEKMSLTVQLRLAKPDVIKIHCLMEFYNRYIFRLQFCIEFEKSGLKWNPEQFDAIIAGK